MTSKNRKFFDSLISRLTGGYFTPEYYFLMLVFVFTSSVLDGILFNNKYDSYKGSVLHTYGVLLKEFLILSTIYLVGSYIAFSVLEKIKKKK